MNELELAAFKEYLIHEAKKELTSTFCLKPTCYFILVYEDGSFGKVQVPHVEAYFEEPGNSHLLTKHLSSAWMLVKQTTVQVSETQTIDYSKAKLFAVYLILDWYLTVKEVFMPDDYRPSGDPDRKEAINFLNANKNKVESTFYLYERLEKKGIVFNGEVGPMKMIDGNLVNIFPESAK